MTGLEILDRFRQLGIDVELVGEHVQVSPLSKVPGDLWAEAKAHKEEIVRELRPAHTTVLNQSSLPVSKLATTGYWTSTNGGSPVIPLPQLTPSFRGYGTVGGNWTRDSAPSMDF